MTNAISIVLQLLDARQFTIADTAEVSPAYISQIINGQRPATPKIVSAIAQETGLTEEKINELLPTEKGT